MKRTFEILVAVLIIAFISCGSNRQSGITATTGEQPRDTVEREAIPISIQEEKPKFQGGDANNFSKWVQERMKDTCEKARKEGLKGRITISFTVNAEGCVEKVKVFRSQLPAEYDSVAVRVVSSSPRWEPGKSCGRVIPIQYTFPIIIQ